MSKCGTVNGYYRHIRAKEIACRSCKDAMALHKRKQRNSKNTDPVNGTKVQPCGTQAGYKRHIYYGEEPCEDCKQANSNVWKSRKLKINVDDLIEEWGLKCFYCDEDLEGKKHEIDHWFPKAKGGKNNHSNFVISCVACNRTKRDQLPLDWVNSLGW